MKTVIAYNIIRWVAYVLGGLITAFFLFFIVGHIIGAEEEQVQKAFTAREISLFVFLGIALVGLIVAYFRPLPGGCLAVVGTLAFLTSEAISRGRIWSLPDGKYFYLLLLPGILYLIAGFLKKQIKSKQ